MNKTFNSKYSHIKATFRTRPFKKPKNHNISIIKNNKENFKRLLLSGFELIIETEFYENAIINENILNKKDEYLSSYKIETKILKDCLKFYKDYIIIDIRNEEELNNYKIKGSINYPLFLFKINKIPEYLNSFKSNDKLIIYYHNNNRYSELASQLLYERGFTNLLMLDGGIEALKIKKSVLIEKLNIRKPIKACRKLKNLPIKPNNYNPNCIS